MKTKLIYLIILICPIFSYQILGSDSTEMVKYSSEFLFTDGVFLDFEQVKKNAPVEKAHILSTIGYDENGFFEEIMSKPTFSFFNNFGKKFDYPVKNIWGYSNNGVLYKKVGDDFFRVTLVGAVCHFVAYVTTYDYNSYPYNPYNRYGYYDRYPTYRNEKTDLKQYLIDFKTGKTVEFTISNFESIIVHDMELYDEFISLRKKKKKKMKFIYLRKFNERNPIYFPKKSILK